jgi:hypothetical protein
VGKLSIDWKIILSGYLEAWLRKYELDSAGVEYGVELSDRLL